MGDEFPKYIHPSTDRFIGGDGRAPGDVPADELTRSLAIAPVVGYVRWRATLPLESPKEIFCDRIDLLTDPRHVRCVESVDSSFVMNGLMQADTVLTGYELLLDGDPTCFSCEDDRGQAIEWGKPTWDVVRTLVRGYEFSMCAMQRYVLCHDAALSVARVGSAREPVQKSASSPQPYVDRINDRAGICAECRLKPHFGPAVRNLVEMTHDSRYLDSGKADVNRFRRPVVIEKGIPISAHLAVSDAGLQKQVWRAAANEPKVFKGGDVTIELRLRGFELTRAWAKHLLETSNAFAVGFRQP